MADLFAAVRVEKIRDLKHLNRVALHGQRLDPAAKTRVDPARTNLNLAASDYADDPLDLVAAFKERKRRSGATEYGKAAIGLHAVLVVSPDLVSEHGDPHEPKNPINQKFFEQGQRWAESEFGSGSVIGARLDMDEAGSGVLDLIIVPVASARMNKNREKKIISVNKALDKIQEKYGTPRSYEALQDSWSTHAKKHIDKRLKRGRPKKETARRHIHADVFREVAQEIAAERNRANYDMQELERKRLRLVGEKERAQRQADAIIEKAKTDAEKIRADAEQQIQTARREAAEEIKKGFEEGVRAFLSGRLELRPNGQFRAHAGLYAGETAQALVAAVRAIREPLHTLLSRVKVLMDAFPPEEAKRLRSQVSRDWDFGGGPGGP